MSYKVAADFAYDIEEDRTRYLNVVFSFIRDCVSFDLVIVFMTSALYLREL